MFEVLRFSATALFLLLAVAVFVCEVAGLFRFKYALSRMHAAALGDTFGLMLAMCGLCFSAPDAASCVKCLVLLLFMWLASPVSSHLIARLEAATNPNIHQEAEEFRL